MVFSLFLMNVLTNSTLTVVLSYTVLISLALFSSLQKKNTRTLDINTTVSTTACSKQA